MTKKMMIRSTHPVSEKFAQLLEKAAELGISLQFGSGRCALLVEGDDTQYHVEDIESPGDVFSFPPETEYKITYMKLVNYENLVQPDSNI
jgi:hypothetical protein